MTNIPSYEITKISLRTLPFSKKLKEVKKMNGRYFTQIRNDVLDNPDISLEAKGLYSLISYNLTISLRELLLDPTTRDITIKASKELEKFDYAHFNGLEECIDKKSYIGLHVSVQPTDEFKQKIDNEYAKMKKELER